MNNQQFAHAFFYADSNESAKCNSMSYHDGVFYSYDTAVARIVPMKSGEKICLIGDTYFSGTTSRHLALIREACPFLKIEVPVAFDEEMSNSQIIKNIESELVYLSEKLSNRENRLKLSRYYGSLLQLLDCAVFSREERSAISKIKRKFKKQFDIVNSPEAVMELKKKLAEKARKEREKQKRAAEKAEKRLSKLIKGKSLTELVEMGWGHLGDLPYDVRSGLRKLVDPSNRFSFLFKEGDEIKTTRGLSFPASVIKHWLGVWKSGDLKIGEVIDRKYTVLSVKDDAVKIGCHLIPTKNLSELCDEVGV